MKVEKYKFNKYLDVAHEIADMWDVDSTIIVPIVMTVNGQMAKSLEYLKIFALGNWMKSQMQKAVLLDTTRIVRRFLWLHMPNRR